MEKKVKSDDFIHIRVSKELKEKFWKKCESLGTTGTAKLIDFMQRYVDLDIKQEEERRRNNYLKHDRLL